jgi:hypothetical protein
MNESPKCDRCLLLMRETTESDDRAVGQRSWICDQCKAETTTPFEWPDPPLADRPTRARPGSEKKIQVMEERVAAGKAIFHPRDNRMPLPPEMHDGRQEKQRGKKHLMGAPGVRKRRKRYEVRVHVGSFSTQQEADLARDEALKKLATGEEEKPSCEPPPNTSPPIGDCPNPSVTS